MDNNQSESKQTTQNNAFVKLTRSKDFEEYLIFAKATLSLPADIILDKISESEQKEIIQLFNKWVKAGKPAARSPLDDEEPEKMLRVSRIKAFGKQFLTAIISGKDTPLGIKLIPTYRRYTLNGKTIEDKSMIVSNRTEYTMHYTKEKAQEFVDRCLEESDSAQFVFKQGGQRITIRNPKNFTADFDDVLKDARAGTPV